MSNLRNKRETSNNTELFNSPETHGKYFFFKILLKILKTVKKIYQSRM